MGLFSGMKSNKAYSLHVKGNRLSDMKKFDEAAALHKQAIELYQQAMDEGDKNVRNLMAYGVLLMRMREFEKAREVMLATERIPGITRDQKNQLRINFAVCVWKLGQLDKAIELMKQASEGHITSMIYGSLGYMLIEKAMQTGDFEEAKAFNEQAMEYDDEDPIVLDNMGELSMAMGEREKARAYFEKAHELKPRQVDTLYHLAKIYIEEGDKEKAREYLTDALGGNYSSLCTTTREQAQTLLDSIG